MVPPPAERISALHFKPLSKRKEVHERDGIVRGVIFRQKRVLTPSFFIRSRIYYFHIWELSQFLTNQHRYSVFSAHQAITQKSKKAGKKFSVVIYHNHILWIIVVIHLPINKSVWAYLPNFIEWPEDVLIGGARKRPLSQSDRYPFLSCFLVVLNCSAFYQV